MLRNDGFSLLEMLVALAISAVLTLSFFALILQFQKWGSNLDLLLDRDQNLRLAPLLLCRYLQEAGNNRWRQNWSGVKFDGDRLEIRSDSDGAGGFPDFRLEAPFESIALRHQANELKLKSGPGSFQPLLRNIAALEGVDLIPPILSVRIRAITDRNLADLNQPDSESISLDFFLWNYRSNLFPERVW